MGRTTDLDFSGIKLFSRHDEENKKRRYQWGSGDQAEFFKNPIEITIIIIIII